MAKCDANAKYGHNFEYKDGFVNPVCTDCGARKRGRPAYKFTSVYMPKKQESEDSFPPTGYIDPVSMPDGSVSDYDPDNPFVQKFPREKKKKWTVPLLHPRWSIEQCPKCEFPEADGGYCPECGWMGPSAGVTG